MIPEISAADAAALLEADASAVYLDVRTEQEFVAGHPRGALNVPAFFFDAAHRGVRNPDFEAVVESHVAKDRTVLVGCQSGVRSLHAADMLLARGYRDVRNVESGFGGTPFAPGWAASGLPVDTGAPAGRSYQALRGAKPAGS